MMDLLSATQMKAEHTANAHHQQYKLHFHCICKKKDALVMHYYLPLHFGPVSVHPLYLTSRLVAAQIETDSFGGFKSVSMCAFSDSLFS